MITSDTINFIAGDISTFGLAASCLIVVVLCVDIATRQIGLSMIVWSLREHGPFHALGHDD
jgi:hypothetical protein